MQTFYRCGIFIVASFLFAIGGFLAFHDKTSSATACFAAAVLCFIFLFLAQFKKFRGMGLEAELWEDKQREAEEIIAELRPLALNIGRLVISMVSRIGRPDSHFTRGERLSAVESVEQSLRRLGIAQTEIDVAKGDHHHYIFVDLASPVVQKIIRALQKKANEISQQISHDYPGHLATMNAGYRELTATAADIGKEIEIVRRVIDLRPINSIGTRLEKVIDDSRHIDESEKLDLKLEVKNYLDDLQYYAETRTFRRRDKYLEPEETHPG